jgi:hypothetical protein
MAAPLVPRRLLDPVVKYFTPQRVILFGSRARGEATRDSDIDLLVILDDDTPPEKLSLQAMHDAAKSYPRAADVIPMRAATGRSPSSTRSRRGCARPGRRIEEGDSGYRRRGAVMRRSLNQTLHQCFPFTASAETLQQKLSLRLVSRSSWACRTGASRIAALAAAGSMRPL